jgi:outer membrane protein assembly factor BamC
MSRTDFIRAVVVTMITGAAVLAGACSGTLDETLDEYLPKKEAQYKSSTSLPPLEVPPDLSSAAINDALPVPGPSGAGTATYSEYASGGQTQPASIQSSVLPEPESARIERAGDKRWLVITATPAQVWPRLREFWLAQGFLINMEDPSIGIIETDWSEQRTDFKSGGFFSNFMKKLSSGLYGAATRDKFRTRLERGTEPGTTEVYISHRGAEEVSTANSTRTAAPDDSDSKVWQPRPADPELEAEMLNRMLIAFGVEEQRARTMMAETQERRERATMVRQQDGAKALALQESFSRAWRRTGLALDRVGFTVEDRDRSRGLFFVRYVDPEADVAGEEKKGFLSKLKFWGSDEKAARDDAYLISLIGGKDGDQTTQVIILNKRGEPENSDTADRILGLLHEQLK